MAKPLIEFREYQKPVFNDRETGILIIFWSRQIGKSFTMAAWAVDRLLTRPGRLVTVLSNSKDNGAEFALKCVEIGQKLKIAKENLEFEACDDFVDFEEMKYEIRIKVKGKVGRIKVLAASPRTARGFSGDLIIDEFAFHEDGAAIWDAAEPILSSNQDFLCRIASTGNGVNNMFYRMVTEGVYPVNIVRRSDAWRMGVKIFDPKTRKPITPEEAREAAIDKASYDQNYECKFASETGSLLTNALINKAKEASDGVIVEGGVTEECLRRLDEAKARGNRVVGGLDVAASRDYTVGSFFEEIGDTLHGLFIVRIKGERLPTQKAELRKVLDHDAVDKLAIDETGIGLGLVQDLEDEYPEKIIGVNFAESEVIEEYTDGKGNRRVRKARVTEVMATDLVEAHEDGTINYPVDGIMREDLRKPKKIRMGSRISIAAESTKTGHGDHFWSIALGKKASKADTSAAAEPPEEEVPEGYKYKRGFGNI